MSESSLPVTQSRMLAGLMKLDVDESPGWSTSELGAILRHQLLSPLEYDLRTLAPGGERAINDLTAAITTGPRPQSFGDLITHPLPPIDLLRLMKDFSKSGKDNRSLPPEVATVFYYASLALSLQKHGIRISDLDNRAMRKGAQWCLAQTWVEESLRQVFSDTIAKLPA